MHQNNYYSTEKLDEFLILAIHHFLRWNRKEKGEVNYLMFIYLLYYNSGTVPYHGNIQILHILWVVMRIHSSSEIVLV